MFKNILSSYEFMGIWSIVTMGIFLVAFIFIVIYTLKTDKKFIDHMSALPFEDNNNENK